MPLLHFNCFVFLLSLVGNYGRSSESWSCYPSGMLLYPSSFPQLSISTAYLWDDEMLIFSTVFFISSYQQAQCTVSFREKKWCKNAELQQNKQTENHYQSNAHGRGLSATWCSVLCTVHSQLLSSHPVCCADQGLQGQVLWLSPFWGYFSLEGICWTELSLTWGGMNSACSPIPSLGGSAWPNESQQLCCVSPAFSTRNNSENMRGNEDCATN